MKGLGKTQQAVYDYIREFIQERSFPPTVREIGAAVGLKSTSSVHSHLKGLADKGYIRLNPSKQRSITLAQSIAPQAQAIPLVGTVAAGQPIFAEDNIQDYYSLPTPLLHGAEQDEAFLLRVSGQSMIDIGMMDGDMIVVHSGISANNGDIVVARIGGDTATVKRVFFEKSAVRLQPENTTMAPIYAAYADVEIIGKVIGLLRQY
ncbi:MAG TPA: transcriptional repressor LexA [Clostridia bacterium]|nr:transcriptional repressor LexA [Clostridia bacterium]